MNSQERIAPWITCAVLGLLLLLVGCQGLTNGTAAPQPTPTPTPVPATPAPTASLSASPATIQQGQSSTLTWQTQNATQVSIDGIGAVDASGSRSVQPSQSTTYKLTATGAGGSANASASVSVTVPPPPQYSLQSIQHIVFMLQENRSFDNYFGHLPQYWAANGFAPVATFEGEPADASNPNYEKTGTVTAYHVKTVCIQSLSPFWDESHVSRNLNDPTSATPTMDGFVWVAANYARQTTETPPVLDKEGLRTMGYYTEADLNYYYFMASNFATADHWFSPLMSNSQVNRLYGMGATSEGHVRPSDPTTNPYSMKGKNIFDLLQAAGVSWKVYVTDPFSSPGNADTTLNDYSTAGSPNIVPVSQYFTDLQNGTLPAVAFIETGYTTGQDEHPNNNVQTGATYAASLINALMTSSSWKSSVFMLTYDEAGQLYDHVPPQPAVSPDGIPPVDLLSNNICSGQAGQQPACDFTLTGFRVPLLVISPFTKKHFVWQKVADYTAILKFIETRFKLSSLTKRDAAQPDMTEFFDFQNPAWLTPPSPPGQLNNGTCDFQSLQ